MKKYTYLLMVGAVLMGLLAACAKPTPTEAPTEVPTEAPAKPEKVTLKATFAAPKERWDLLIPLAMEELNKRHPDMEIDVDYEVLPYADAREKLLAMMAAETPSDLVSVDCIWLGEFAEGGFLRDITADVEAWGRMDEWYDENRKGSTYKDRYYGIWSWTDARVMWYWKDLLEQAGVDPQSMSTWDGYIDGCSALNEELRPEGIEGCHLVGAGHSPDMWFPYLWMQGGKILEERDGKSYPAYNSDAGVSGLQFLADQVEAGVEPQTDHFWGQEFADKKFAVMLEGSWLLGKFPEEQRDTLEDKIGMLPMFPVPAEGMDTATMMGGWELATPTTSEHPDLAFELMTIINEPDVLTQMLAEFGYLPTQKTIAEEEPYASTLADAIPFFEEMVEVLPQGHGRPNIAEYPELADQMRIAIEEVYYGKKSPQQALDDAVAKSAETLGW
ncbi:MAG: extracellular solute-binding protein [Chloroflexota bacterium]|nr:extracellular solute-binding protein [Chloroflexota bacterium]